MLLISNTGSVGSSALTSLRTDDTMAFAGPLVRIMTVIGPQMPLYADM